MYDLPNSDLKQNSNLLANLQKAYREGKTLQAAIHEFRGVTNVWEVVRNIDKALTLPGGIYNFGSGNNVNSYELFLAAATLMKLREPSEWILPDADRFSDQERNLTMNCASIEAHGIHFNDSIEGIREALQRPFRTK